MPGNDGRTRVRVPDDWRPHGAPLVRPDASALLHALEAHIETLKAETETLKAQLAAAEARAERQAAETAELTARHAGDLAAERAKTEVRNISCLDRRHRFSGYRRRSPNLPRWQIG